jgi:hypothetical protein
MASVLQTQAEAPAREERNRTNSGTALVVEANQLPQYEDAWWKLSDSALAPNVFCDPWMLLPAIERYPQQKRLRFLLVFGPAGRDNVESLWGFPLEIRNKCLHLPIRTLAFWQHGNCHLTVPLIQVAGSCA